jgi:hypothetical protein
LDAERSGFELLYVRSVHLDGRWDLHQRGLDAEGRAAVAAGASDTSGHQDSQAPVAVIEEASAPIALLQG